MNADALRTSPAQDSPNSVAQPVKTASGAPHPLNVSILFFMGRRNARMVGHRQSGEADSCAIRPIVPKALVAIHVARGWPKQARQGRKSAPGTSQLRANFSSRQMPTGLKQNRISGIIARTHPKNRLHLAPLGRTWLALGRDWLGIGSTWLALGRHRRRVVPRRPGCALLPPDRRTGRRRGLPRLRCLAACPESAVCYSAATISPSSKP